MNGWTLREITHLLQCQPRLDHTLTSPWVRGYSVDSRTIQRGELFFAVAGATVDGHDFVKDALRQGACAAVVERPVDSSSEEGALLVVPNVVHALQTLAHARISSRKRTILGVTGSLGKSSVKGFVGQLLSEEPGVFVLPGNQNSQLGLPLAILNHLGEHHGACVLEQGMSRPGELQRLVACCPPDIALVTTVSLVHASAFSDLGAIAREKGVIFSHPRTRLGIFPQEVGRRFPGVLQGECEKRSFSIETDADVSLRRVDHQRWHLVVDGEMRDFPHPPVLAAHHLHNILAACVMANAYGVGWDAILQRVPFLQLPERRMQQVWKRGILWIDDSHNAAESSVKAALASMPAPKPGGKKYAVLGEMLDLGEFSVDAHENVARCAVDYVDELYCYGDGCSVMQKICAERTVPCAQCATHQEIIAALHAKLREGDVVLVKGSHGKEMWKVVEGFSEP